MQILSTTKAKRLNKKRNLFGLGFTSLIAACSADGAADGGDQIEDAFSFKAEKAEKAEKLTEAQGSGYTAEIEKNNDFTSDGTAGQLDAKITTSDGASSVFLNFPTGGKSDKNTAGIYKLTDTYDLVISAPNIDKEQSNNAEYIKGRIFIYWDVATVASSDIPDLEIKGGGGGDQIGTYAPEFLQLGSKDGYDMVIRSEHVDKSVGSIGIGAIYILWDVADYAGATTTPITLDGSVTNIKGAGLLTVKGGIDGDRIGIHAPEFLQIGSKDDNYDMVISSYSVNSFKGAIYILWDVDSYSGDKTAAITLDDSATGVKAESGLLTIKGGIGDDRIGTHAPEFLQLDKENDKYDLVIRSHLVNSEKGAIYILWDVDSYSGDKTAAITLDDSATGVKAESGLLTIKGATEGNQIGIYTPEFLQLGGKDNDNKLDMVIRSDKDDFINVNDNEGAIYILWDVDSYSGDKTAAITLDNDATGVKAESGLLKIKGAIAGDQIGTHAPEFLQLGKENDKYDLIIQSEHVNKSADSAGANVGAIYVLWDVADYAGGNETINLTSLSSDASSGLLTIYGTAGSTLGSSDILYRADNKDSDVDGDGTNDLVFKNENYTYVLFGDKIAEVDGATQKVKSKTIDLDQVNDDDYFGYGGVDKVGYRFAGSKTFAEVKAELPDSNGLSDADGVWDIA